MVVEAADKAVWFHWSPGAWVMVCALRFRAQSSQWTLQGNVGATAAIGHTRASEAVVPHMICFCGLMAE